jgi:hypothetical protein
MSARPPLVRVIGAIAVLVALVFAIPPAPAASGDARDPRLRTSAPKARGIVTVAAGEEDGSTGPLPSGERSGHATFDPLAPVSGFSFEAIPRTGGNWPADPTGAVSDTWYFTAVNTHYALYDLTGQPELGPASFANLFDLPSGTQVFDPKVAYDPYGDTFVLTFLGVNDARATSWILVVTIPDATADDRNTWCGTRIAGDRTSGDGTQWPDYPGLGFSVDRVAITTNQFDLTTGGFSSAQILSFPKSNLYDCSKQVRFDTFVGNPMRDPDGSQAFTVQPAISVGATPRSQFFVSLDEGRPANLVVWRLRPTDAGLKLAKTAIPIKGAVAIAPYGTQCNGSLNRSETWWDPGDLRFVTAFYDVDRGRLYAAHVIRRDLTPDQVTDGYVEAVVRWYDIRPDAKLRQTDIVRRGVIGEPESDVGWPAIASDADGNLFVTYSRASRPNDECLSAYAAEILPKQTEASSILLAPGEARFEAIKGPERWGDFAAAVRDPVDGSKVALINQYAAADGGSTTLDWQQIVHVLTSG